MVTRRDVMTGGAVGALSAAALGPPAQRDGQNNEQTAGVLRDIQKSLDDIHGTLSTGFESNRVAFGHTGRLRDSFTQFMRANFKFPDYVEIGMNVFYDVYDWHIKHNRQLEVSRVLENRMAVRFMFTLLVVRPEQDGNFIGVPYDR
jgi:hypothetical protein